MIISSCDKEDPHNDVEILKSRSVNSVNTYRDDDYRDLARVLSIGVEENLSLRNLLKNEAILKYDGDYDILVNKIKNEQLTTSSGQQSFSEYIGSIYARLNLSPKISGTEGGGAGGTTTTIFPTVINYTATNPSGIRVILNSSDIIPYLVSVYPIIQISIPVHADSWDVTTYPPICIYVPEDYNEPTTLTIEGFDNGTSVTVDAVNEPNEPVIVVSDSERANIAEALADPPNVSIQLTAVQSATGITLSWTVTNPNNDVIGGYKIYKKTLFSNSFVAIADNLGKENTLYNDNEVDAANVTFKDITNAKDENCGKREHKYLNAPSPVLEFPLGGVKLHLTN